MSVFRQPVIWILFRSTGWMQKIRVFAKIVNISLSTLALGWAWVRNIVREGQVWHEWVTIHGFSWLIYLCWCGSRENPPPHYPTSSTAILEYRGAAACTALLERDIGENSDRQTDRHRDRGTVSSRKRTFNYVKKLRELRLNSSLFSTIGGGRSLKFIRAPCHVMCTGIHWLRPRYSLPPPAFGLVLRARFWSAKIDDISL